MDPIAAPPVGVLAFLAAGGATVAAAVALRLLGRARAARRLFRITAAAVAVVVILGPTVRRPGGRLCAVLVDADPGRTADAAAILDAGWRWLASDARGEGDVRAMAAGFGAEAVILAEPAPARTILAKGPPGPPSLGGPGGGTGLARALAAVRAARSEGETLEVWAGFAGDPGRAELEALLAFRAEGARVALERVAAGAVGGLAVRARCDPPVVAPGEAYTIVVGLAGRAARGGRITIEADRDERSVEIAAGPVLQESRFPRRAAAAGPIRHELRLRGDSGMLRGGDRVAAAATVIVTGPPEVLVVATETSRRDAVAACLRRDGRLLVRTGSPAAFRDPPGPSTGLVVLANVPVRAPGLSTEGLAAVRSFVEGGGGLFLLGGPDAFAPGGYDGTVLAEISPLDPRPDDGRDVDLALDVSGSMEPHLPAMVAGARSVLRHLGARDRLRLLPFNTQIVGPSPPPVHDPPRDAGALEERLSALSAFGGTRLIAPIEAALSRPREGGEPARTRSLILLTDGRDPSLLEGVGDIALLRGRLRAAAVELHVVVLAGRDAGPPPSMAALRSLAGDGAESSVALAAEGEIPEVLVRLAHRPLIRIEPLRLAGDGIRAWAGPVEIGGLVRTRSRDGATVSLRTEDGDPVLAEWRVGPAVVAAVATDPSGPWAEPLRVHPTFLQDLALRIARPALGRDLRVIAGDRELRVEAPAGDRRFSGLRLSAVARGVTIPLVEDAPGVYRGVVAEPPASGDAVLVRDLETPLGWFPVLPVEVGSAPLLPPPAATHPEPGGGRVSLGPSAALLLLLSVVSALAATLFEGRGRRRPPRP